MTSESRKLEDLVESVPKSFLEQSGSVFYAGREAFSGSRPMYLLGLNPGGDPTVKLAETVRWHMDKVLRREPDNWSAYRDESWEGAPPGTWRMQPRVLHLLGRLGLDPGTVPSSNIVFLRSRREGTIDGSLGELAEACWPFHQRVIEGLGVRTVVCFGQTAGRWLCRKLGATQVIGRFVEQNNRRWTSTSYRGNSGIAVVIATHPSIADWTSPDTDPSGLVHQAMLPDVA